MQIVLFLHTGSPIGVCPYTTAAVPRYSRAQSLRTGSPSSSVSPDCLSVQPEGAHFAGGPALQLFFHSGVRDDELPAVKDVVRLGLAQELLHLLPERLGLASKGFQRCGEPVLGLDLVPGQRLGQLRVVVSLHDQGVPAGRHVHRQGQGPDGVRSAVGEIAREDHPASVRMVHHEPRPIVSRFRAHGVAEPPEQLDQLVAAAVHVPEDVERAALVASVAVQQLAVDAGGLRLVGGP